MIPYSNYNTGFNGYNYAPMMAPQPQQAAPQSDERIWVQNQTSAEAYLVAPSGFVRLWDSNAPRFYEKKADASGRPYPMEIFEYKKISPILAPIPCEDVKDYGEEIKALNERITALEKRGEKNNAEPAADN